MSYDSYEVPDGIEPLVGFRGWKVQEGKLFSCYREETEWPMTGTLTAECIRPIFQPRLDEESDFNIRPPQHSSSPYLECTCGIYALHQFPKQWEVKNGERRKIPRPWPYESLVGIIKGWGRIDVGTKGFRAQYARPVAIIARRSMKWKPVIEEIATRYHLEIIDSSVARAMGQQNERFSL